MMESGLMGERNGKGKFISNSEKYLGYWKDGKKRRHRHTH